MIPRLLYSENHYDDHHLGQTAANGKLLYGALAALKAFSEVDPVKLFFGDMHTINESFPTTTTTHQETDNRERQTETSWRAV